MQNDQNLESQLQEAINGISLQESLTIQNTDNDQQVFVAINASLNQYHNSVYHRKNGLRKSEVHQIKKMKVGKTSQICSICISKLEKGQVIKVLPCSHILHSQCCKQWFRVNEKCPICRFHLGVYFMDQKLKDTTTVDENFQKNKQSKCLSIETDK